MTTKIAIKSDNITPFGGIFYAMDEFSRLGLNSVIDKSLGLRSSYAGYQYSEIISSLFWIYYCGGDHIEDIGKHLGIQYFCYLQPWLKTFMLTLLRRLQPCLKILNR